MPLIYEPSGLLVRQQGDDYRDRVRCNLPLGIGEIVRSFEHQPAADNSTAWSFVGGSSQSTGRPTRVSTASLKRLQVAFDALARFLRVSAHEVCTFVFPERKDDGIQGETPNDVGYWNFHGPVHLSGGTGLSTAIPALSSRLCSGIIIWPPWIESLAARTPKKTPRCLRTEPATAIASTGHG